MDKFFNTCKRCLHPKVLGLILIIVFGLLILVPKIGVAGLVVALPFIGCTVMCGAMAFFYARRKEKG